MSVGTMHVVHGINLPTGEFISQLDDATPAVNTDALVAYAAGHPQPLFRAARRQRPALDFTTPQIKTVFDALIAGTTAPYCRDLSGGNVDFYLKKATDLGVRTAAASSAHIRLRLAQSFLYWTGLRASQDGEAQLTARILPSWDGVNNPIVAAGGLALAGTSTAAEVFTLGPIKINGSFVGGLDDMSLDPGAQVWEKAADGDGWATFIALMQADPVLTFNTVAAEVWTTYALAGTPITALSVYLRRRKPNEGNYADADLQHIKITATAGQLHIDQSRGGINNESSHGLRIGLTAPSDAGSAFTIATAQAIT